MVWKHNAIGKELHRYISHTYNTQYSQNSIICKTELSKDTTETTQNKKINPPGKSHHAIFPLPLVVDCSRENIMVITRVRINYLSGFLISYESS